MVRFLLRQVSTQQSGHAASSLRSSGPVHTLHFSFKITVATVTPAVVERLKQKFVNAVGLVVSV